MQHNNSSRTAAAIPVYRCTLHPRPAHTCAPSGRFRHLFGVERGLDQQRLDEMGKAIMTIDSLKVNSFHDLPSHLSATWYFGVSLSLIGKSHSSGSFGGPTPVVTASS